MPTPSRSAASEIDGGCQHFVFPAHGEEFSNQERLVQGWKSNGLEVVPNLSIGKEHEVVFTPGFAGGGVVRFFRSAATARKLIDLEGRMKSHHFPYGTAVGSPDGLQMRKEVQVVLPDPVPRIAALVGAKPTRDPRVLATFEHVDVSRTQRYVLVLPPERRKLAEERFIDLCLSFELTLLRAATEVAQLVGDLNAWFENPDRRMLLFELDQREGLLMQFARLYYVAQHYDLSVARLRAVHLLANFGDRKPNFRTFWTSNR